MGGQSFDKAIRAGDYRTTEPRYRDVEIRGQRFRLWGAINVER
jgi:hypothetical protein